MRTLGGFDRSQVLLLALVEKGVITEAELEEVAKRLIDTFRLKNILSLDELEEVRETLRSMKLPDRLQVRGGAYTLYVNHMEEAGSKVLCDKTCDRVYSCDELEDLLATLDYAGFRNKKIKMKLEKSLELSRRYA